MSNSILDTTSEDFPLDFLVVGTMKSGTSTLSDYLKIHPEIGIPENEVHFFDLHFDKGLEWYRDVLLSSATQNARVFGEKTPFYAWSDTIASQIQQLNSGVKLIWLFRDPVERLISHFRHNQRSGLEPRKIQLALEQEDDWLKRNLHFGYLMGSKYQTQVERYLDRFPKSQMLLITFEEFVTDPHSVLRIVNEFIGVSNIVYPYLPPSNEGKDLYFPSISYWIRKQWGRNNRLFYYSHQFNQRSSKKRFDLPSSIRQSLTSRLRLDVEYLRDEFDLKTHLWKNYSS